VCPSPRHKLWRESLSLTVNSCKHDLFGIVSCCGFLLKVISSDVRERNCLLNRESGSRKRGETMIRWYDDGNTSHLASLFITESCLFKVLVSLPFVVIIILISSSLSSLSAFVTSNKVKTSALSNPSRFLHHIIFADVCPSEELETCALVNLFRFSWETFFSTVVVWFANWCQINVI
jgi:hypothetical protein